MLLHVPASRATQRRKNETAEMESAPATTTSSTQHGGGGGGHVFLLAFPEAHGHVNPILQLGRHLAAHHGLLPTLVTTRHVLSTLPPPPAPFRVAAISDGFDSGGMAACGDAGEYTRRLAEVGSETLRALLRSEAAAGRPPRVLVYDPHLPWAGRVARGAGVPAAAFFSQPCAVDVIYGEVWAGRVGLPVVDGGALRGLLTVELGPEDVPSFVKAPESYPPFLEAVLGQFDGLEDADDVLVNSFQELEPKWTDQPTTAKYIESAWGNGVRIRRDKEGMVRKEEVERCIREVLESERKAEYRKNANRWMTKAKEAMKKGGCSNKNIAEFASKYASY
uniref:Uncharacterized protein n=1 Tax=Oryza meridionalis TaxID=40149 RepID=A0A0E0DBE0_9ORYZ